MDGILVTVLMVSPRLAFVWQGGEGRLQNEMLNPSVNSVALFTVSSKLS